MVDVFPECIVDTLVHCERVVGPDTVVSGFDTLSQAEEVFRRPLDPDTDPNGSVAVFAKNWVPLDHEIGADDTRGKYNVVVQTFCKFAERDDGIEYSGRLVKSIRVMVYRDPTLRVALGNLSESILGVTERTFRWGIGEQRFQNNSIRGAFAFASVSEFWLETEVT